MNDLDILQNAHRLFTLLYKKKFGLEYAWNVLRFEQKWCDHTPMNPTPKTTSSNKRKADDAAPSTESVVGEHESRPPGIKAMKRLRNKGKDKVVPSANITEIWEVKQKDLEAKKELQKMSLLDTLIARKDTLDEDEKLIKKSLILCFSESVQEDMGLDSIYDYGINSPLDYSSEDEADSGYYALQLGLAAVGYTGSEEEAQAEEEAQPDHEQRLVNLERFVAELGEKKPKPDHEQRLVNLERVVAELGEKKPKPDHEQRLVNLERVVAELGEKKPKADHEERLVNLERLVAELR
ncbi:hypothetical protein Rs2_51659 [Raphanus sativus]|nr:hypothetical protein Rs2_51659 [Raphanus sativus]